MAKTKGITKVKKSLKPKEILENNRLIVDKMWKEDANFIKIVDDLHNRFAREDNKILIENNGNAKVITSAMLEENYKVIDFNVDTERTVKLAQLKLGKEVE